MLSDEIFPTERGGVNKKIKETKITASECAQKLGERKLNALVSIFERECIEFFKSDERTVKTLTRLYKEQMFSKIFIDYHVFFQDKYSIEN